jgi:di/tricarboxylate transporter
MMDQATIYVILAATLVLFLWGRWRYDLVAVIALLAVALTGLVSPREAFTGFGHPAVITVAAVLIVSQGLASVGIVDRITAWLSAAGKHFLLQVLLLIGLTGLLSGFINDIGALGLMMPVAIRLARENKRSPSTILMPLAFSSILGGLITGIGTPPNIYISAFRAEEMGEAFRILDFLPVGAPLLFAGVLFVSLIGWRLLPQRSGIAETSAIRMIEDYLTELIVPQASALAGQRIDDVFAEFEGRVVILGIGQEKRGFRLPSGGDVLRAGDILIVEAATGELEKLVRAKGFELAGKGDIEEELLEWRGATFLEVVILPEAALVGRNVRDLNLRYRYRLNLLGISRQGQPIHDRLRDVEFEPGDVLLLQGRIETVNQAAAELGVLLLQENRLRLSRPRRAGIGLAIFGFAISASMLGWTEPAIAFSAAAVLMVLTGILTLPEAYRSINWPVILLLGGMIPVGKAFEATGASQSLGQLLAEVGQYGPAVTVVVVMVITMLLSNVINKSAATVLMAPLALAVAQGIGASPDPLLMAVAVGASSAFLTPIGHHCNTVVMGPGGYHFGDYWRMGLPTSLIVLAITVPLIVLVWGP